MKPSTNTYSPKPLVLVFRDWVLIMPFIVTCFAVTVFVLACWLGDGTLASLYEVDYFMPLPLYCTAISIWTFLPMTFLGFVATGVSILRRRSSKSKAHE